jgi:hypothetical protein
MGKLEEEEKALCSRLVKRKWHQHWTCSLPAELQKKEEEEI